MLRGDLAVRFPFPGMGIRELSPCAVFAPLFTPEGEAQKQRDSGTHGFKEHGVQCFMK